MGFIWLVGRYKVVVTCSVGKEEMDVTSSLNPESEEQYVRLSMLGCWWAMLHLFSWFKSASHDLTHHVIKITKIRVEASGRHITKQVRKASISCFLERGGGLGKIMKYRFEIRLYALCMKTECWRMSSFIRERKNKGAPWGGGRVHKLDYFCLLFYVKKKKNL